MKKAFSILPLFLLLIALSISCFDSNNVKANNAFYSWGALKNASVPDGEYGYEWYICNLVPQWMPSGSVVADNYEGNTNPDNLYWTLFSNQINQYWTGNLWVGDYTWTKPNDMYHFGFYSGGDARNYGEKSWDASIYYYTSSFGPYSAEAANFVWTCACGGTYFYDDSGQAYPYPYSPNPCPYYGYWDSVNCPPNGIEAGMPSAWTGRFDMSTDGYRYPDYYGGYLFIGWENSSPYLMDYQNSWTINYYFLYMYHAFALGQIDSNYHNAHDSLDYASNFLWGQNYQGCPYDVGWLNTYNYWTRLRVLGNSLM